MTKDADDYNAAQLAKGLLTIEHVTELVTYWQKGHGLEVDGKAGGEQTIPSIAAAASQYAHVIPASTGDQLSVVADWLVGPSVRRIDANQSWFGGGMATGKPLGIVAHYTDTDAGTSIAMAQRRARPFGEDPNDRAASWHITVETDGSIVVMIPLNRVAWHAGSSTALPIPGIGSANANTVGIELVGFGKVFPPVQVTAASHVWRAVVTHYGIAREHAMITHQSIDPSKRDDPGPVWMKQHAEAVLSFAYQS